MTTIRTNAVMADIILDGWPGAQRGPFQCWNLAIDRLDRIGVGATAYFYSNGEASIRGPGDSLLVAGSVVSVRVVGPRCIW